jgi:SAM-dependent methyltransferase
LSALRDTGERVVPDWVADDDALAQVFLEQHLRRYEAVAQGVRGKRVLDVGCGVGYGAVMLAEAGATVLAIDVSADAIDFARSRYPHRRITYECTAVTDVDASALDVITCFEVLEHLGDPSEFFDLVNRAMAPNGVAHISASIYPTMGLYKYHLRDLSPEEFRALVRGAGLEIRSELHQRKWISPADVRRSAARHRSSFPMARLLRHPLSVGRAIWRAQVAAGILHENLMLSCTAPGASAATTKQTPEQGAGK